MNDVIRERFEANLARVRRLVVLYEEVAGAVQGRPRVEEADILRAAVVLLHATLEDLLRSLAERHWPSRADPIALATVHFHDPIEGGRSETKERFTIPDLARYRGQSVNDLLARSIRHHLAEKNFNNLEAIKLALRGIGLPDVDPLLKDFSVNLAPMITRRHLIAHKADRNDKRGYGQHAASSLGKGTVRLWIDSVERFGQSVLSGIGSSQEHEP